MKQKIQILLMAITLAFAGCGSDRTNNNEADSLLTDTAVLDTADMQAAPVDTTVMRVDSISQYPGLVTH